MMNYEKGKLETWKKEVVELLTAEESNVFLS
jgi:hypothetical protein